MTQVFTPRRTTTVTINNCCAPRGVPDSCLTYLVVSCHVAAIGHDFLASGRNLEQ